jgi:hypothetical protein
VAYVLLAVRGFIIVGLVSWQTINLQRGSAVRIAIGSFGIGLAWYSNVLATIADVPYGWCAYSIGSMLGALVGWKANQWV